MSTTTETILHSPDIARYATPKPRAVPLLNSADHAGVLNVHTVDPAIAAGDDVVSAARRLVRRFPETSFALFATPLSSNRSHYEESSRCRGCPAEHVSESLYGYPHI